MNLIMKPCQVTYLLCASFVFQLQNEDNNSTFCVGLLKVK